MSSHTSGPWRLEETTGMIYGPDGYPISIAGSQYGGEPFANARLITAAPEMLEALKVAAVAIAAAIAKAEGR